MKKHQPKPMTSEARKDYVAGATVREIMKTHGIEEHTIRDDLRAKNLLRSRGKRKGHKAKANKPSYNDVKEQKESKHFASSIDTLNQAFRPNR